MQQMLSSRLPTPQVSFPDGTLVSVTPGGDKVLQLPNGQVEEHTRLWKRRRWGLLLFLLLLLLST